MIRSFGLHWREDRVFWGRPNDSGTLDGAASRSRRAKPVDFREQRGIYALYAEYELVYVGQTGAGNDRLFRRLKCHRTDHLSERWDRFSWFGTQWVTERNTLSRDTAAVHQTVAAALNMLEAVSVAISEPRLNLQRGRWGDTTQYYQWWDREEDEEDDE
ncbi:GIY-YIG nuclease family protein [Thermomonas sp. LB-4]|uniref:GIY-YIG nuclease family protein n=1 Tax=Thermomonas sp. LB-4 TaxID=3102790 RepID=UPI002ED99F76